MFDRHVPPTPAAQDVPNPFRFSEPGLLRDAVTKAGAIAPCERLLQFNIQAPISVEELFRLRCEKSEKLREKIGMFSSEQLAEVKRESLEALREYSTDAGLSLPAQVLIVSGTKQTQA